MSARINTWREPARVVLTLGHHGDVILVGRGAQYLLPPRCALRVRLVAPLEERSRHMAELRGVTIPQARVWLKHVDEERLMFIAKHFHSDAASPLSYDLVINTGDVGYECRPLLCWRR